MVVATNWGILNGGNFLVEMQCCWLSAYQHAEVRFSEWLKSHLLISWLLTVREYSCTNLCTVYLSSEIWQREKRSAKRKIKSSVGCSTTHTLTHLSLSCTSAAVRRSVWFVSRPSITSMPKSKKRVPIWTLWPRFQTKKTIERFGHLVAQWKPLIDYSFSKLFKWTETSKA